MSPTGTATDRAASGLNPPKIAVGIATAAATVGSEGLVPPWPYKSHIHKLDSCSRNNRLLHFT